MSSPWWWIRFPDHIIVGNCRKEQFLSRKSSLIAVINAMMSLSLTAKSKASNVLISPDGLLSMLIYSRGLVECHRTANITLCFLSSTLHSVEVSRFFPNFPIRNSLDSRPSYTTITIYSFPKSTMSGTDLGLRV